jgi:DNA repair exonuclease SbcCD ATPase subunit
MSNTLREEFDEVCSERDKLRAENTRLREDHASVTKLYQLCAADLQHESTTPTLNTRLSSEVKRLQLAHAASDLVAVAVISERDAAIAANTRQRVELEAANAARISALAKDRAEAYQRTLEEQGRRARAEALNTPLRDALGGGVVLSAKEGHFEAMASCPLCGHAGHPHGWAAGRCAQADCRCVVVHVLVARMPAVTGTTSGEEPSRG